MKRTMKTLRFAAIVAAAWLAGAATWPLGDVLGLLGDAGCC